MLWQHVAVHAGSDQRVGVHRFLNWDATNEWRHLAGHLVESAEHDMFACRFHAGAGQYIFHPDAAEDRRAYSTSVPLHAGHMRLVKAAAVAGAFQGVGDFGGDELSEISDG